MTDSKFNNRFINFCGIFLPLLFVSLLPTNIIQARDVYLKLSSQGERLDIGMAGFSVVFSTESGLARTDGSSIIYFQESRQLVSVIRDDLAFTRFFNIVEGGPLFTGRKEELEYWGRLNADIILTGEYRPVFSKDKKFTSVEINVRLLDVTSGSEIWSSVFKMGKGDNLRRIAHKISDEIVLRLTGERGIASTRIVFSNDATGSKEIYVIDYDGKNLVRLTDEHSIAILPKFSPDGEEIVYTTYKFGNPDLYAINTRTLEKRAVSTVQGLNTAAVFSPDSQNILLTQSRGGSPNLYLISRRGDFIKRLTNFRSGIDTSPSYSPLGNQIAFISNRAGYPQVYIMDSDGGNIRRISTRGNCDSPSWSPRGDRIAFSQFTVSERKNDIYVYEISNGKVSRLTFQGDGNNENPTWSPDGRYIAFISTRNGKRELFRMYADGSSPARIADIPGRCYTPNWSPRFSD